MIDASLVFHNFLSKIEGGGGQMKTAVLEQETDCNRSIQQQKRGGQRQKCQNVMDLNLQSQIWNNDSEAASGYTKN